VFGGAHDSTCFYQFRIVLLLREDGIYTAEESHTAVVAVAVAIAVAVVVTIVVTIVVVVGGGGVGGPH